MIKLIGIPLLCIIGIVFLFSALWLVCWLFAESLRTNDGTSWDDNPFATKKQNEKHYWFNKLKEDENN